MRIINLVLNEFTHDSRVLKTSKTFKKIGHQVIVVALHGEKLLEREIIDDISVHRISLKSRSWSKSKIIQMLKFIEFAYRFKKFYGKERVIHCNDLNGLLVGVICKIFFLRLDLIYDSHEFAINDVPNEPWWSIRIKYFLEHFLINFAKDVIVVSESIATEYSRLHSIKKPHLLLNCPYFVEQNKKDFFRQCLNIRSDQLIFLYQGGLSKGRGIEILLKAFEKRTDDRCVLVCMGYGPLEKLVKDFSQRCPVIFFQSAVNHSILLEYTSSADFGILFYEDTCLNHRYCSPNKIFEYLMAGIPVITSNLYEMKRFIEAESIGLIACENTVDGFGEAVENALSIDNNIFLKKISNIRKKYCWENQEKVLIDVYKKF
jgi:glycosyltransferase involved in cell wall biosynthesis